MPETLKPEPCPCKDCSGQLLPEREVDPHGTEDYLLCTKCGYCPDPLDDQIGDCPLCQSFSFIINQGNIICSGCGLELTKDDETTAITAWNSRPAGQGEPVTQTEPASDEVEAVKDASD